MVAGVAEASVETRLREVAECIGAEFRKTVAVIRQQRGNPELVGYDSEQVDVLYELLARGVIEVGPECHG
jgi:hypothetical protein